MLVQAYVCVHARMRVRACACVCMRVHAVHASARVHECMCTHMSEYQTRSTDTLEPRTCARVHACLRVHVRVCVSVGICARVSEHVGMRARASVRAHVRAYICACVRACVRACVHIHVCLRIYACRHHSSEKSSCACARTDVRTHICTACMQLRPPSPVPWSVHRLLLLAKLKPQRDVRTHARIRMQACTRRCLPNATVVGVDSRCLCCR